MGEYGKVNERIKEKLREICGEKYTITEKNHMVMYTKDETAALEKKTHVPFPKVVVKPASVQEVSEIMKLAYENRISVTPRGAGTGLTGGSVPLREGILLSLERMNKLLEVDKENLMATVQPTVTLKDFREAVMQAGLYFPSHPGNESASIGGAAATNIGGTDYFRFGPIRNYIKKLQVVLPNGEILNLGAKLIYNSTGYSLRHLFIGSEGTLGIITKITLRLMPPSPKPSILIAPFEDLDSVLKTIPQVVMSGIMPLGVISLSNEAISITEEYLDRKWPVEKGKYSLLIPTTGENEDAVLAKSEKIMSIAKEHGASDVFMAKGKNTENIWAILLKMTEAIKETGVIELFDVSVPPEKLGMLIKKAKRIAEEHNAKLIDAAFSPDGSTYLGLSSADIERFNTIKEKLYATAADLGGVITGKVGIGLTKREDLHISRSEAEIDLMRRIKRMLDPQGILNPGKVLPEGRSQ